MSVQPSRTETSNIRAAMNPRGPRNIGKIEKAKDPRSTMKRLVPYLSAFKLGMALVLGIWLSTDATTSPFIRASTCFRRMRSGR